MNRSTPISSRRLWALTAVLSAAMWAGTAGADDIHGSAMDVPVQAGRTAGDVSVPAETAATAAPLVEEPGVFPPPRTTPVEKEITAWHYSTDYFMGLTRGLEEEGMHPYGKYAVWICTVPLDVAILPMAAIAGLFG